MAERQDPRNGGIDPAQTVGKLIVKLSGEGLLGSEDIHAILRTTIAEATSTARPVSRSVTAFLGAMHDAYVDSELEFAF
jgi:phage tail tape-measure protein